MTGELAEGAIPGLLQEIYVGRRSGTLKLVRGDERQSLRFRGGHIVNAHTNVVEERLGEVLVRRGLLSEQDLASATEIVVKEGRRLGEVLVELGLLTASGLEDAVALHVHEMLAGLFTWKEGSYTFEDEAVEAGPAEELTLKLSTGDLILEAVQAVRDPDVVRYALGDLDRVLALSNDPLLRFQKLTLSPADGFVLSRVDGTASAREIMQMIPLPPEDTQRSLLGLLSTGVIEYVPGARRAPDAAAPVSTESAPRPVPAQEKDAEPLVVPADEPVVPAAPSAPAAEAGPGAPPPPPAAEAAPSPAEDDEAEARRREIMEAWEGLKTRTHFEVLGLARSATESDVKEAYFRLARRFHPDVHHGASLGDMRDRLEAVFIRLGEAYDVLRDRDKRADYESRLGRPRPAVQPAGEAGSSAAGGGPEPEAPRDAEADAKAAEVSIRKAIRLFEKAEDESPDKKPKLYSDAIQLLEGALPFATGRLKVRGGVTLARCYLKNPNWARRAEELLLGLVKEDPKATDPLALLAGIYRDNGLRVRALSTFRRVLELQPDHEEAARYVARNAPASTPAPEDEASGGGLLKKLFRKP
jgi:tetratricopeptide (TPR) repeat protein